jgi:hypothetical protein
VSEEEDEMRRALAVAIVVSAMPVLAGTAGAAVLRVGSYHGVAGQYTTIQAAVDAAKPGDWVLVGPGDYKTKPSAIRTPKGGHNFPAGVLITTRGIHIRGMNRSTVVVDGTKPGSAVCSSKGSAQNFGLSGGSTASGYARYAKATPASGVNGLMVFKADNVSIENLTACNFLGGSRDSGNEIWWNGGADTGKVGGHGFSGAYLTTTSTYLKNQSASGEESAAQYGVFSSNWSGGTWDNIYGSNFNDSGFYIGACRQVCDQTLNHGWAEYNALGYSGTNSGGRMLIENSQFDNNEDGFDTNSQNADEPAPQNGACPKGVKPPVKGAPTCWVFYRNYVHDNNNPNVPAAGSAAAGPVGTGMSVSGARNDTIMDNRFVNNNAWGVIFVPYLDSGGPCTGGTLNALGKGSCLFDEWGDALVGNTFTHNGAYGHDTNGDWEEVNFEGGHPTSCYSANTNTGGSLNAADTAFEQSSPTCNGTPDSSNLTNPFLTQALCDARVQITPGASPCPAGLTYPRATKIVMRKLPTKQLSTMPNPCAGVPSNAWCRGKKA